MIKKSTGYGSAIITTTAGDIYEIQKNCFGVVFDFIHSVINIVPC